ncbi:hypothetical protein BpHYR1_009034 [Brachionus plicatilis]|uniref:Uncharacterized protein n=1 Tax=Brachionus plicatilis TaxID=10195 RepID=A0A3M7R462_BRAPC|nr:hypothetical protein BpHYR1_009034 [Brachionus plicatilis]
MQFVKPCVTGSDCCSTSSFYCRAVDKWVTHDRTAIDSVAMVAKTFELPEFLNFCTDFYFLEELILFLCRVSYIKFESIEQEQVKKLGARDNVNFVI